MDPYRVQHVDTMSSSLRGGGATAAHVRNGRPIVRRANVAYHSLFLSEDAVGLNEIPRLPQGPQASPSDLRACLMVLWAVEPFTSKACITLE